MELAARMTQREVGLDRLAAHLTALDPDTDPARARLERKIGADLATLLVAALSRSVTSPLARPLAAVAA
jgi:hypothetical protein